ncbi:MAG: hypothetical protein EHM34_04555 [Nitrosopumilales archaeon]|nr:MAG: hypothetical protein EHM34_04555 [Nitrosopumilales archaeon]
MIQWDSLIVEMVILAAIIWFAVYLEHWALRRIEKEKEIKERKYLILFIDNDLNQRLRFIDESLQFKDYKPFFTDLWDAVVLAGKHPLLPFALFQNLQRTYSWMKYYNNEIDARNKGGAMDDNIFKELLQDVTKQINGSLVLLALEPK